MNSLVVQILVLFSVLYALICVVAVEVAIASDIQFGHRYDVAFKAAAGCVAGYIVISRNKRTLEKWEFHVVALGSVLVAAVISLIVLLRVMSPSQIIHVVSAPIAGAPILTVAGIAAYIIGLKYVMAYWTFRAVAWQALKDIDIADKQRRFSRGPQWNSRR